MTFPNPPPWSDNEAEELLRMKELGISIKDIALVLGRKPEATRSKLKRLMGTDTRTRYQRSDFDMGVGRDSAELKKQAALLRTMIPEDTRDWQAMHFGDPIPCQSALGFPYEERAK